jgi:hypothetical protein
VRKQRVVLKYHADAAPVRRQGLDGIAVEHHFAGVRRFEAGDSAQHRRLAAARRTEQRHELARADMQAEVTHGFDPAAAGHAEALL